MKSASLLDFYQCQVCFDASYLDVSALRDFYLPLIGADAFASYFALLGEKGMAKKHQSLLGRLNLTPGEFENAMRALEAVGLVRTFVQAQGGANLFVYCLSGPLSASEFQNDIMLAGTLKGKIGAEEYDALCARHQSEEPSSDLEEVTISFPEYFKPAYDPSCYLGNGNKKGKGGKARAKTGFDKTLFLRKIEQLGLRKGGIASDELEQIAKIGALYSIAEQEMASFVFDAIRPNAPYGKKVDVNALSKRCAEAMPFTFYRPEKGESSNVKSDTVLAEKIRMMDEISPAKFLEIRQGGHKPAFADLKLVERLTLQIGLPSPCVNALLDYVLETNDNALPSAYCEKLAASLVREGCRSARDAMDYLKRSRKEKRKATPKPTDVDPVDPVIPTTPDAPNDEEDVSAKVDALLNDLYKDA
ncbi:MAG: hypothetical protein K6E59_02840 [Bacilli bacterium]|nr:hypothetical protein [Bacilli bacterium]